MDQRFYELIWQNCRSESDPYTVLRKIALLRYKSPVLVLGRDRLTQLDQDLVRLAESGVSHRQIAALREVCAKAVADGCALTVSGDMYPELWRTNA
jgi:hypothetical protein